MVTCFGAVAEAKFGTVIPRAVGSSVLLPRAPLLGDPALVPGGHAESTGALFCGILHLSVAVRCSLEEPCCWTVRRPWSSVYERSAWITSGRSGFTRGDSWFGRCAFCFCSLVGLSWQYCIGGAARLSCRSGAVTREPTWPHLGFRDKVRSQSANDFVARVVPCDEPDAPPARLCKTITGPCSPAQLRRWRHFDLEQAYSVKSSWSAAQVMRMRERWWPLRQGHW